MGKISKVYYEEIEKDKIDIQTAGEFYYLFNLLGVDPMFHDEFEESETRQMNLRNSILGERKRTGIIPENIQISSSVMAVSSIKNKVIVFTDTE